MCWLFMPRSIAMGDHLNSSRLNTKTASWWGNFLRLNRGKLSGVDMGHAVTAGANLKFRVQLSCR